MSSNVSHQPSRGTQSWVHLLMRSPAVITSPAQRAMTIVLILIGGLLTIVSGVIHLYLWGESNGYRLIPAIGPLFLAQGIAGVLIGLALIVTRRVAVVLAAAGLLAATAAGLVITIEIGLFGFRESWAAPYVSTSLYEEITGAVLLLIAAWSLARSHSRAADQPFSRP